MATYEHSALYRDWGGLGLDRRVATGLKQLSQDALRSAFLEHTVLRSPDWLGAHPVVFRATLPVFSPPKCP